MVWDRTGRSKWKYYFVAIVAVAFGTAVRVHFLEGLGTRVAFVTLFPAVMVAAVYGGAGAGVFAAVLSALAASMWWIEPVGNPLVISDLTHMLGMAVFVVSCLTISALAESAHRAQARANEAEARALVAAEREKTAAALGISEERLRLATAAAEMGVFEWNAQTDSSSWENDRMYEIFGRTGDDGALSKEQFFAHYLHPDDADSLEQALTEAAQPGRLLSSIHRIRPKGGGDWRWVELSGSFELAGDGSPLRLVGVLRDITERMAAEHERANLLAQVQQRYGETEAVLSAINDAVLIYDTDMNVRRVNAMFVSTYGFDPVGLNVREVIDRTRCRLLDGRPLRLDEQPTPRALQGEKVVNKRYWITRFDGAEVALETSSGPLYSGDDVVGSVTVWHDITSQMATEKALRQSQEDLNRAQAVGQIGSWRMNVQRNELLWSDENHRMFGIPKGTPMTYESFLGTIHPDDREYVHEKWSAALHGEPYDIEHRIVMDGSVKWVRERAELELDHNGQLLGGFGTTQDITERKKSEDALRESEARFRLLSKTAARLLESEHPLGVVHDLAGEVMTHLDCDVFFNFLADERAQKLHLNAYAGVPEEEARKIEWLEFGVAVCGCVARDGVRIVAEDICSAADPRTELVGSYGIQAYACHPLSAGRSVIGTLSFGTRTRSHFSPQDLDLMKTVADQVSAAVERVRLLGEIERSRDELERRVQERTAELAEANRSLAAEVSERIRAERSLLEKHEQLLQSEELLRTVLDALPVGVWITDEAGTISQANPAAQSIWRGARYVHLEDYGEYQGWWADTGKPIAPEEWSLARALTHGEVSINEVVDIQCFDGARKTILNSAAPVRNDRNEIVRAIVVNQDITELRKIETALRRSEERLRTNNELLQKVFDGITEPLVMLDSAGLITMLNKAAMDYYTVGEGMDCLGKTCFQGLRGREAVCPECEHPFLGAETRTASFERKSLRDPGRVEHVTVYPVLDERGSLDAFIVRISDITQARILERQILQNEKLASLGLVTSGIAHEINNPNSFIYFNLPILKSYLLELMPILDEYAAAHPDFEVLSMSYAELREDIFSLLENMEHGSERISRIVGVLKSFVRRKESEGMQRVDLKQLIDKVVVLCHTELRHRVRSFESLVPENLPPFFSEPEALEQVVMNLLINAIHACDKPDSRVSLRVEQGPPGTDGFVIEIKDNGSGIEDSVLARIFDPFFTTKSSSQGTGLGLYICHNHVESLGGSIEVESRVGEGTTFRVVLPGKKAEEVE